MNFQLKTRQVCLFIIAFMPVTKLFILPSVLATHAKEDMWISATINLVLDFITLLLVINACKRAKTDFFTLLENNLGKPLSKIVIVLYFFYFMLKSIVPLNEQKDYVELTLYTLMPSKFYFLPFFAVTFYFCCKKLRIVGRSADLFWLFTIVGIVLLISLSIPNADLEAILPIGGQDAKSILSGSYVTLGWFGDASYLLFFIGNFEYKKKDGLKIILSYLIASVAIIAFMIIFYCVFTSIAFRQRFALTEISKYTAVINNIGRFDYVGIIPILLSSIFALSIPLFLSAKILDHLFKFKKTWISALIVSATEFFILVFFTQYYLSIERLVMNYLSVFFLVMANVLPIFTALLKNKENYNEVNA